MNKSNYADAVRKTVSEPVIGNKLLFDENLITYKEIEKELYNKLKQLYPNDQRIQSLDSKGLNDSYTKPAKKKL
ncbi:hypothetical protein ACIQW7_28680 [Peribacillus simplex]|uniref:hypothetical protein n=1 Tax=Peribacillus simplex TaxID=1478 RepID=UPI003812BFB0